MYRINESIGNGNSYHGKTFDTEEEAIDFLADLVANDALAQGTDHELNHEPSYNKLIELCYSYYSIEETN